MMLLRTFLKSSGLWLVGSWLLALVPRSTQAQLVLRDADRHSAHLGITTGIGTTWLVDAKLLNDPNYEYVQTYRRAPIGLTFGYHFNDRNGAQVEVNRTMQGADFQIIEKNNSRRRVGTKNARLTYWSVPILFKYTAGAARRVRFEFHVGPQLNFLAAGSEENHYSTNGTLLVVPGKTDLTEANSSRGRTVEANTTDVLAQKADFRSQTLGAAFGLGLEFRLFGDFYMSTLLRGTYSFDDIRSDQWVEQVKVTGYHNDRQSAVIGMQIGLHYQFIRVAEGRPKDRIN